MFGKCFLSILPLLLTQITALELYDEGIQELGEVNAATPLPILRSRPGLPNFRQKQFDIAADSQFLLHNVNRGRLRETSDTLKSKLVLLLRQAIKDFEVKMKYLQELYAENKSAMAGVSGVLSYVERTYREVGGLYTKIEMNYKAIQPTFIVRALNKLRRGELVVSTILGMFDDDDEEIPDQDDGSALWKDKFASSGIAWSYYDDSLG